MPQSNYCTSPTLAISAATLGQTVQVIKAKKLDISFFYYSSSNPRKKDVHNCDSSLKLYIQKDSKIGNSLLLFVENTKLKTQAGKKLGYR